MARLLWEYQGQVIKDYPMTKGSVTIGRGKENAIIFRNSEVSSCHARIDKIGADYILTDLQSTNGTLVNSLKVFSHRLSHGDRISIGKNELLFIGTEKAKLEAERASIPLDRTVIIGGSGHRKKVVTPQVRAEENYVRQGHNHRHLRVFILTFIVVGALVGVGVFVLQDKAFLLRGILPTTSEGHKTGGKAVPPSEEVGRGSSTAPVQQNEKTTQEPSLKSDVSLPMASERLKASALNDENLEIQDAGKLQLDIEAIVWSSEGKNSFAVVNGIEVRVGDSIEGKTITRIERDHVVFRSQEGEFISRLKFQ